VVEVDAMTTTNVALSDHEFFLLVTGAVVPLVVYVFNHFAQGAFETFVAGIAAALGVSLTEAGRKVFAEAMKGIVQVSAAAGWGVIYTAVINNAHGVHIFKGVGSAIIAALFAHKILWAPSNINVVFGAQPSGNAIAVSEGPQALGAPAAPTLRTLSRGDLFV
jgi:hypothetical protein